MPRQKDLKRLVRARMQKTGEAYTAARAKLLAKAVASHALPSSRRARRAAPSDYAGLAGMSDATSRRRPGARGSAGSRLLDYHGAADDVASRDRDARAREIQGRDWWTQTVTVGYERIKGLRARGSAGRTYGSQQVAHIQRPDQSSSMRPGSADASARKRWLNANALKVRTATAPKTIRLDWTDGSIIAVGFTSKGKSKSAVALESLEAAGREAVKAIKEYWSERFDALADVLK